MKIYLSLLIAFLFLAACSPEKGSKRNRDISSDRQAIALFSDNQDLAEGFSWAKKQALQYAHGPGDSVGLWFEAALPGRDAFCMRDVSHQAQGALLLGLDEHLKNMFLKFSQNISESKDWCSFWEINKNNQPAPVDYTSDADFWYNLPANFDLIDACYRSFQWTGDSTYLTHPDLINFYTKSLNQYIRRWDSDKDGFLESPEKNGTRGIPTYWEAGGPRIVTGTDLIAAQYAANMAYGRMLLLLNEPHDATRYFSRADKLYKRLNNQWWYTKKDRFYSGQLANKDFDTSNIPAMQIFALYWDIADNNHKSQLFANLQKGVNVEENTYLTEVFYKNGMFEKGFQCLMAQVNPKLQRREYPENPFTVISTVIQYIVGLRSYASENAILTRSGLSNQTMWVEAREVPVLGRVLDIMQVGTSETEITLTRGEPLLWHSRFPGAHSYLMVNGKKRASQKKSDDRGNSETQLTILLEPGQKYRVQIPPMKQD